VAIRVIEINHNDEETLKAFKQEVFCPIFVADPSCVKQLAVSASDQTLVSKNAERSISIFRQKVIFSQ